MSTTQTDPTWKSPGNSGSTANEQMLVAGDRLGHCRIIELIAAGGMANVYKVWHEQLEVIRAIKILKPGFSDESRGRLETEAKISANLHHANIVEIYGLGYWKTIPYIEMEYVDGPALKELLEKFHRLPVQFAIALSHAVCVALQFAYNQDMTLYGKVYDGLIHRDIKPANILINSHGKVKLADFGIARPSEVSLHTVGSKVMGTFAYLSPEQLNGERLDQRSDVYSLGAVLYEMISGSKTFPQKLLAELVQKKSRGQFIPLDSTGIQLPRQLCGAVDKSLALERTKRFIDAGEFDQELMNTLRKLTTKAPEDIICAFLKTPHGAAPIHFDLKKKERFLYIILFCILFSGVSVFYYFNRTGAKHKNQEIKNIAVPAVEINVAGSNPKTDSTQIQNLTPVKKAPVAVLPEENPYELGVQAFESKDYSTAISMFESSRTDKLSSIQRNTRILKLIQCYLNTSNLEKAIELSEQENIGDATTLLLIGEAFFKQKRFDEAFLTSEKCILHTSDKNCKKKAINLQIRIGEAKYQMKPNRDNKQACLKSWDAFKSEFCADSDNSSSCQEAREKISKYSE